MLSNKIIDQAWVYIRCKVDTVMQASIQASLRTVHLVLTVSKAIYSSALILSTINFVLCSNYRHNILA